ncbi:A24 family peptidase [Clostridioides sp. ZZV14-6345]|uniref:prepilin peptidase n=1 Tax=Clostridioides sp. ZZV14-6345 TaxID=2811496 RepID=UPI001D0FFD8C
MSFNNISSNSIFSYFYDLKFLPTGEKIVLSKEQKMILLLIEYLLIISLFKHINNIALIIKGFLYAQILIYASYVDYRTKLIPNKIQVLILFVSFIKMNLYLSIINLFLFALPLYLSAILKNGGIGGGDIKLMGSSGFLIGFKGIEVLIFILISLILAFAINHDKYKNGIALAPYISVGCFLSYLL